MGGEMRQVEVLIEIDDRLLGDTVVVEVPWDMVTSFTRILEGAGIIVLASRGRRYRVAAGNVDRLYQASVLLHAALRRLERILAN
jgi:hypothetical protein